MWKHNQTADHFRFAVLLQPGTSRIVVSGTNWVDSEEVFVRLFDREEREVRLIAIGRDLHGAADLSQSAGVRLSIETSSRPADLAIWSHSRPHSSDLWRRVLPRSLSSVIGEVGRITHCNPAAVAESLAGGALSDLLEEISSAWSRGTNREDAIPTTVALLQYLACHPLHRSDKLGALVAALCQKPGTI
jgi:hypothetical protein